MGTDFTTEEITIRRWEDMGILPRPSTNGARAEYGYDAWFEQLGITLENVVQVKF